MRKLTLIVAIKPRCYSQAIGEVIAIMRSSTLEVAIVEPEELEAQLPALEPEVVLCSQPRQRLTTEGSSSSAFSGEARWVEFYPYAVEPEAVIYLDGRAVEMRSSVELEDLLRIIDKLLDEQGAGLQRH